MKLAQFTAVAIVALALSPVYAQQAGTAKSADSTPAQAPTPEEVDKQVATIQERMRKMHEQMAKIQQTQDPAERQKLLQEHWDSMQDAMTMMSRSWSGMMGPGCCAADGTPMMGGHMKMGGGMMWGNYQHLTPDQLKHRQYMMDQWMPMQQMMMGQMMQHQHWMMMHPVPPPAAKKK